MARRHVSGAPSGADCVRFRANALRHDGRHSNRYPFLARLELLRFAVEAVENQFPLVNRVVENIEHAVSGPSLSARLKIPLALAGRKWSTFATMYR